jgi:outer membrane lipoprotein SlyB
MRHLLTALFMLLAGCAGGQRGLGGDPAARDVVKFGVIESVTQVKLDNSSQGGTVAGSIFGQVGGANTGTGKGSIVGSIFGNVLGGTLGHQAGIATRSGLELWVKLDGEEQSTYVMQPGNPDAFYAGDRVRVLRKKGETHVELDSHAPDNETGNHP